MMNKQSLEKLAYMQEVYNKNLRSLEILSDAYSKVKTDDFNEPVTISRDYYTNSFRVNVGESALLFISTAILVEAEELEKDILQQLDNMREIVSNSLKEDENDRSGDDSVSSDEGLVD